MSIATADNFKPTNPKPFSEWELYPVGDGTYRHWASTTEITNYFAEANMSPSWSKYKFFWIAGVYHFYTGNEFIPIGAPGNVKGIAYTNTIPAAGATIDAQYIYFSGPGTFANFPDENGQPVVLTENLNIISWDGTKATVQAVPVDVDLSGLIADSDLTIEGETNIYSSANTESGKMDPSTFALVADPTYIRTKSIPVAPSTTYDFSGFGTVHYGIIIRFEDASGNYISGSGKVGPADATDFSATSPSNAVFIRFIVKTAKSGDNTDINLIVVRKSGAVDKVTKIKDYDLYSKFAVNQNALKFIDNIGKNKFPLGKSLNGYYDPSTFLFTPNNLYKCIPIIAVPASSYVTISGLSTAHWALGVAFFKSDGSPCTQKGTTIPVNVTEGTVLTPSDCAGLGYTWHTSASGDNSVEGTQQLEIGNVKTDYEAPQKGIVSAGVLNDIGTLVDTKFVASFAPTTAKAANDPVSKGYMDSRLLSVRYNNIIGKNFLEFGDSITETMNINGFARSNWPIFFASLTGTTYSNYAKSGAHFANGSASYPEQQISVQIQHAIDANEAPDGIIISIGTNDFALSHGDYATAMSKNIEDLDLTLSVEAARWAFWKCREQWPEAPCFYVMPIQRASLDVFDQPVYDDFRRMAERYGFIVIEAGKESGIVRDYEVISAEGRDLSDGLHPKISGQIKMANCIALNVANKFLPY